MAKATRTGKGRAGGSAIDSARAAFLGLSVGFASSHQITNSSVQNQGLEEPLRRLRSLAKGSRTACFGAFDELTPEIVFRSESVMSRATQGEIRGRVLAALGEWLEVVKFEPMRLGATPSSGLDMRALLAVAVELAFGAMFGSCEDLRQVGFGEVRAQHQETGEVQLARREGVEQGRKAPDEPRSGHAATRLVLRESELIDAVGVEAGTRARAVDPACFDFSEVAQELSHELVRATDQAAGAGENLGVREMPE
jgi:hypothetical protein